MSNGVPIADKYLLSISEAAEYFNIGINKMYKIASEYDNFNYDFVIHNGSKVMIKRKNFEKFLSETASI